MYINSEYWLSTDRSHLLPLILKDPEQHQDTSVWKARIGTLNPFFFCKVLHINDVGNWSDYPQKTKSNNQNRLHDVAVLNTSSFDDWAKFDS